MARHNGRRMRMALSATAAMLLAFTLAAAATPASAAPAAAGLHYGVIRHACAVPARPDAYRCFALRRVDVAKGTRGARAFSVPAVGAGPSGGYTPADLARLYSFNPDNADAATQTIAIIDWSNDPSVLADLNTFDEHYGLPDETSTSFRVVNQNGAASPLPADSADTATEIALDVEAARGVCHRCKIVLVEADATTSNPGSPPNPTAQGLAIAVNSAVALGATEISNSYGAPENRNQSPSKTTVDAYRHVGVVITASTGDAGWYDWDDINYSGGKSSNAPSMPASYPGVVAVAGTKLTVTSTGARAAETVWNDNGPEDSSPNNSSSNPPGASGGGCSVLYPAEPFQSSMPGYSAAGCTAPGIAHSRLTADIAAVADPFTGFDIYDSYGGSGWQTVGGTSLASPIIAAMWALAGGARGSTFAAGTLYDNARRYPNQVNDITVGGNSFCGGDSTSHCAATLYAQTGTYNPNNLANGSGQWLGYLDCSFPYNGAEVANPVKDPECNATTGYDGASGVGTPRDQRLFMALPRVTVTRPSVLKLKYAATFSEKTVDYAPNATITSVVWNFGDGSATTTSPAHTYTKAGTFTVTATVHDNYGRWAAGSTRVTVGTPIYVKFTGSTTLHHSVYYRFASTGSLDYNTGGTITSVTWNFGDGRTASGTTVTHAWGRAGTYTMTETAADNTGVRSTRRITITVVP